jgi:hypothetical protein
MHIKNYRANNVVSEYTNMNQQYSFSHITGPTDPHKSSKMENYNVVSVGNNYSSSLSILAVAPPSSSL